MLEQNKYFGIAFQRPILLTTHAVPSKTTTDSQQCCAVNASVTPRDPPAVGNGEEFVTDFQFAVEQRMLIATARAIATAVADADEIDGNLCRISANPCASTSELCVGNNRRCGGDGFADVLPCCDPDFRCFVRDEARFFCRRRTFRPPSFWDGRIEECTLGLAP